MKLLDKMHRIDWIIDYINNNSLYSVDILNQKFVDEYISKFNPDFIPTNYGAYKCKELGNILSFGYKINIFDRFTVSITEHESGFPNWVYCYQLRK